MYFFFSLKRKSTKKKSRGCAFSLNVSALAKPLVPEKVNAAFYGYERFLFRNI
jgi:hypothetical protein